MAIYLAVSEIFSVIYCLVAFCQPLIKTWWWWWWRMAWRWNLGWGRSRSL